MCSVVEWISVLLLWIHAAKSMSLINQQHSYFMDNSAADNDVADLIISKGYLPSEKDLPKTSIVKNVDNDFTYLLSKLSDEELIKLLNDQPKNVYDINDIVRVAVNGKDSPTNEKIIFDVEQSKPQDTFFENSIYKNKRFRTISERDQNNDINIDKNQVNVRLQSFGGNQVNIGEEKHDAFFRLDDKHVDPFSTKADLDPNYAALQKINNLLYGRPQDDVPNNSNEEDERKELLFDVLVAQLKTLCCKKTKRAKVHDIKKIPYNTLNQVIPQNIYYQKSFPKIEASSNEYMFLIINDEIRGNGSDELISVDPESLEKNSSVLLLGPITTPLTNPQLKTVMSRISNELSKPDYLPLLRQIADGTLSSNNLRLMKSLVTGPETRRYIKPHRCNYQSPLSKIYHGPKWIICTGYLNLNTPSLYD